MPASSITQRIQVVDSHTGGEPTRVIVAGGPDLVDGDMAARREQFREQFDHVRRAVVNEPRGSDVLVGALLCPPVDPGSCCGVIFFNNVGPIGMCVHGTVGLVATLAHLGRIAVGDHVIETPVGPVTASLHENNEVSVQNVPSYRTAKGVRVDVDGLGTVTGDVAWGGNWFFLVDDHCQSLELSNVDRLTDVAWRIRQSLAAEGYRGDDGAEIDHIELFGPPSTDAADSKNFVLCPGKAYDRSPCGTGTSAKIACLISDGKLQPGDMWRQESIVGSIFSGVAETVGEQILPTITGSAYITAESTLIIDANDPYQAGFVE